MSAGAEAAFRKGLRALVWPAPGQRGGALAAAVGMSDETYAAILTRSSFVRLATTGFISSVHSPRRAPACMSYIWRVR